MTSEAQLHVLIVDDSADDALLVTHAITEDGVGLHSRRVEDATGLRNALQTQQWDVVISDYSMPYLTAEEALRIVKEADVNLPFIVVSGVIGEDAAVEMMRAGALDYVMKDRLARLLPAIRREMRELNSRTVRDRAEATLREIRDRFEATVERAPVGIANVARNGRFLDVNPRFCEMVGYRRDELLALHFMDITHPLDKGEDDEKRLAMTAGALSEYRTEKRYLRKDGGTVYVSLSTAAVHDATGVFQYFASIMLDITEKKQMEMALRERDERYRQIVDTAQEGIWTVDTKTLTTFVNQRMAAMLGYTREEMLGRPLADFVYQPDLELLGEYTERRSRGLSDEDDFVMRCKSGESIRIHFKANTLHADDGTNIGSLAMVTDVTARWNAEETVLRQKKELEEAQRIASLGNWHRDLPGDTIVWSDEMYKIYGIEPGVEVTIGTLLSVVVPEDRQKLVSMIAVAQEKDVPLDVAYRIVRPDGTMRSVHTFGEIERDDAGTPSRIRGVTQDVTDQVEAAAVHENLTRHFLLLLQSTTQGIFGVDVDGRCTFINRAASESLGYQPGALVGSLMHEVLHHGCDGMTCSPEDCPIATAAHTGAATEVHSDTLCRRDGTILPVEYSAAPIIDKGAVAGAVVVFTDISERKLLQAQLAQSDRVSSLGRLAATMAHEFNNVLMGIQPFAELLSRQNPGESIQRATQNILQAVQRGRSITHSILRFARPAELVKEKIDVRQWLPAMEATLGAVLGDKIRLRVQIDGEALFIQGDRHQLEQVLTNLASNGRDAMNGAGDFTIVVERCMSGYVFPFGALRTVDQYLHVRVTDTGSGMDARTLKDIFDPFFTTKRSGTGLGLAVVHQVLQLHGGSIIAESTVGKGTVFHLFLPFSEEAFNEIQTRHAVAPKPGVASILMVEDDEAVSSGVADLLREEGILVEVAASGAAAMASLALHLPDVVLLDVGLPDIDGRRLYERVAAEHPDLAFIFASGSSDEEMLRPYLRPGHIESLTKPYDFDALLAVLGALRLVPPAFSAVVAVGAHP